MIVEPVHHMKTDLSQIVAIDIIGAGIGEYVLVAQGSAARIGCGEETAPIDAAIVGIIDDGAIIAVTRSGNTARMVSKYRPGCPIIACTPDKRIWRQLNLVWGVTPLLTKEEYSMEILLLHATEAAEENGYVKEGDVVVLTVGVPLGRSGNTNLLKATVVGEY